LQVPRQQQERGRVRYDAVGAVIDIIPAEIIMVDVLDSFASFIKLGNVRFGRVIPAMIARSTFFISARLAISPAYRTMFSTHLSRRQIVIDPGPGSIKKSDITQSAPCSV
jgi:hypothetical protein